MLLDELSFLIKALFRIIIARILRNDLERELLLVLKENQILKRRAKRISITHWDIEKEVSAVRVTRRRVLDGLITDYSLAA